MTTGPAVTEELAKNTRWAVEAYDAHGTLMALGWVLSAIILGATVLGRSRDNPFASYALALVIGLLFAWGGLTEGLLGSFHIAGWSVLGATCVLAFLSGCQASRLVDLVATEREEFPSRAWRIGLGATIIALTVLLYSYRVLDVPGELDAYGTQAMVTADRLWRGDLW